MEKLSTRSEILTRAVEEVIVRTHLEEVLKSGKKLRIKLGIDPTTPDLHLGHAVPLRKLRAFQDAGHQAVLIIGDFTATVGDPSGRNEARRSLSRKEIEKNMKTYLEQAGKIIKLSKTEVHHNSEWYKKAGAEFLYDLMSRVTIQRATERDDFQKRLREKQDISILEVVYPLLQGYDSVAIRADVEIGGSDQKFNLLMGRKIQRRYGVKEQDVLTTQLLEGTDGARKMSKSLDNYIGLVESSNSMFGKLMSISDNLITKYFVALTDSPMLRIKEMEERMLRKELNPRDAKLDLAEKIVSLYHSAVVARKERENFLKVFSGRELPAEIPEVKLRHGKWDPSSLLIEMRLAPSKSEGKRLIKQGAVDIGGRTISPKESGIEVTKGTIIKVGKRRMARIA